MVVGTIVQRSVKSDSYRVETRYQTIPCRILHCRCTFACILIDFTFHSHETTKMELNNLLLDDIFTS